MCPSSTLHQKYFSLNDFPSNYPYTIFDSPFSLAEFNSALRSVRSRSAPGLDGFDYLLISSLPKDYLSLLLAIFNGIFAEGSFPEDWHHSLVFFIPKSNTGKYRPIFLISCFLKVISFRLIWWVEKSHLLPSHQFGFSKSKSCHDNIGILSTEIYNSFLKRQSTSCVFLDIKGAFDHVIPNILVSDLVDLGLPPNVCLFMDQLVYFWKNQFIINGNLSSPYYSYTGVPQGSILSPLLFNIYVANCNTCIPRGCSIIQFANNIAVYCSSPTPRGSLSMVESACNKLSSFLLHKGLMVFPDKTALVVFSRSRINPILYSIKIDGTRVKSLPSHKFLGVNFDYRLNRNDLRLNGHDHITALTLRCSKLINVKRVFRGTW